MGCKVIKKVKSTLSSVPTFVPTKHDIVIESDVYRLELLVFKGAIFHQHILVEKRHVFALKIKWQPKSAPELRIRLSKGQLISSQ